MKLSYAIAVRTAFSLSIFSFITANAQATPVLYTLTTTLPGMIGWAMNESGQVAGFNLSTSQPLLYTPGAGISPVPLPAGATGGPAYSINERGQVAGRVEGLSHYGPDGRYVENGFIYTPGAIPASQLIHGPVGFDYQLNEAGAVVQLVGPKPVAPPGSDNILVAKAGGYGAGYIRKPGTDNGQAWRSNPDGSFTNVQAYLPPAESQAYGVNSSGTVVGRSIINSGTRAFLFNDGIGAVNLFDVTDPASLIGWQRFISAQDITIDGRITGYGIFDVPGYGTNILSGFILTPASSVPVPSTPWLLGAAVFAFAAAHKRRKI